MDGATIIEVLKNFGFPVTVTLGIMWGVWRIGSRVGEAVIESLGRQATASEKSSEAVVKLAVQMEAIQSSANDTVRHLSELAEMANNKRKALRLVIRAGDSLAETSSNEAATRLLREAAECLE